MKLSNVRILLISSLQSDSNYIEQLLDFSSQRSVELIIEETATGGKIALQNALFDVILMATECEFDVRMDLVRWIHDSEFFEPPIIALIHEDNIALHQMAIQAGAMDSLAINQLSAASLEYSIRYAIQQKADEIRSLKQAQFDPLTGLINRLEFKHRLAEQIAQAKRADHFMALMIINLDEFKKINDKLGHLAGDELIVQTAERLNNCIRETDTIARLGGNEFAIIATQLQKAEDAGILAQSILQACKISVEYDAEDLQITCCIGIALLPNDGTEPSKLLKQADMALLKASSTGHSQYLYADNKLNQLNESRQQLTTDIAHAVSHHEFELLFQPTVSEKGYVTSVEALLRWQHPLRGELLPDSFLSTAESSGFIHSIGTWVLKVVCQQQKKWLQDGLPVIPVSINLSPLQLEKNTFLAAILHLSKQSGFNLNSLTIELSEHDIFNCDEHAVEVLRELHDMGIQITVDHFGSDFFSLKKLYRLPIDTIKIDCHLVQKINSDDDSAAIIDAIVQLCRTMNINVVAHGVETPDCMEQLNNKECMQMQGYYISAPMTGEDFPAWYQQHAQARIPGMPQIRYQSNYQ